MIDTLLRKLARGGARRGLSGEHWAWLVLAASAYLLRRARRPHDAVATLSMAQGGRYLVSLHPPARRKSTPSEPGE